MLKTLINIITMAATPTFRALISRILRVGRSFGSGSEAAARRSKRYAE